MKPNRERAVLGAVLALAALGLAIDRVMLGGVSSPRSASAAPPAPVPSVEQAAPAPEPGPTHPSESLTDRFGRFASESGLDIDDIGDAMSDEGRSVRKHATVRTEPDWVDQFKGDYELSLIMGSAGGPYTAYLRRRSDPNPIRVRVGGVVDGFTLEGIEVDSTDGVVAHFSREGRTVTLSRSNGS